MPVAANVPVGLSGATVLPGDYIYADPSGVVVMPSGHLEQILKSAAEIEAEDKASLSIIRHEDPREVRRRGLDES
jgi:regulator of RNase E activity RraA